MARDFSTTEERMQKQSRSSKDRIDRFKEFFSNKIGTHNPKLKHIKLTAEEKRKLQAQVEEVRMEHARRLTKDAVKIGLMLLATGILMLGGIIFSVFFWRL
jgi:hypothetical protein